jgi:hypothetical protein
VNGFLKRNKQEFIFQYGVFTKSKSIISHPFLKHFHYNNSIYKITTPLLWSEGGNLQTDAAQLFLFDPIPAKVKKLGLLSIYKFSLIGIIIGACICKPFKEPRNRLPAWRAVTTTLFVVLARFCVFVEKPAKALRLASAS